MELDTVRLPYQSQELYMVHNSPILAMDFSKDERLLTSGDKAGNIKVWKISDGKCLREINIELSKNLASVTNVKLNPQSSKVFATCLDRSIKIFGLKSGQLLKELNGCHETYIQSFDFVKVKKDGGYIVTDDMVITCGYDGQTVLWQVNSEATQIVQTYSSDKVLPESRP